MTDVRSAAELERLPWLTDERAPDRGGERGLLLGWGIAAAVLIAGSSFWLGRNSPNLPGWDYGETAQSEATVKLPQPVPAEPMVSEQPAMPQVEPVAEPAPVVVPNPPVVRSAGSPA